MRTLILVVAALGPLAQDREATFESLVTELNARGDGAEVETVKRLANLKTAEARDALIELYDVMQSVYMRRAVLQGLILYDELPGLEGPALERLLDAAVTSTNPELASIAVDLIARCENSGHALLTAVVDSPASDEIRVRALEQHTRDPRPGDEEWYGQLYTLVKEGRRGRRAAGGRATADGKIPHAIEELRELAFDALAPSMEVKSLHEVATSDVNPAIRLRAVQELDAQDDRRALEFAQRMYDDRGAIPSDRLEGARILLERRGFKAAKEFVSDATKGDEPVELVLGLAEMLAEVEEEGLHRILLRNLGKGRSTKERLFFLRAARNLEHSKVDEVLIEFLEGPDERLRREALEILEERKSEEALPLMQEMTLSVGDPRELGAALEAITSLRGNDPEWLAELESFAVHEAPNVRNAAIRLLAHSGKSAHLPVIVAALGDESWSTRLAAARAVEELRAEEGVGALATRMSLEEGRMALELGEILFRMTGKLFGTNGRAWAAWWEAEGGEFEVIDPSELRRMERIREARRLRQVSRSELFGIEAISRRVVFVLDISGSMLESTRGRYVGEGGPPRIDLAKQGLLRYLRGLEPSSKFNLVVFSGGVEAWRNEVTELTPENLAEVEVFIERIGASGGTNLYGGLRFALQDPEVDTIYLLSDGEPTMGELTDPGAIRRAVADWNADIDITIHCIAFGRALRTLEWLAEDTGGTYVQFP